MQTIRIGDAKWETIEAGNRIELTAYGTAIVQLHSAKVGGSMLRQENLVAGQSMTFGPFLRPVRIYMSAGTGAIEFEEREGDAAGEDARPLVMVGSTLTGEGAAAVRGAVASSAAALLPAAFSSLVSASEMQQSSIGGAPSLLNTNVANTYVAYWSMSGSTAGQTIFGVSKPLPSSNANGLKVSAILTVPAGDNTKHEVWRVLTSSLVQGADINGTKWMGSAVVGKVLATKTTEKRVLEPFVPLNPSHPTAVRLFREVDDAADDWTSSTGVVGLLVEAVTVPDPVAIQPAVSYNSWPMLMSSGGRLVCAYSKGATHVLPDATRAVYRRISSDGGDTWGAEALVAPPSGSDDSTVGRGQDSNGNLLLWVRKGGLPGSHHLYRSLNGGDTWQLISSPVFGTAPIQISDIISVPTVGLMAFYHAGSYAGGASNNSWGVVKSTDNGLTWTQTQVQSGLTAATWPTEIAGAYLGNSGQMLAIGRIEDTSTNTTAKALFQMQSTDYGATWSKVTSNVTDVIQSTPSLIYDAATGQLDLYYFHRTWGVLKRRKTTLSTIWGNPLDWPAAEAVALGTLNGSDTGGTNAVTHAGARAIAYYSGDPTNTGIYVAAAVP